MSFAGRSGQEVGATPKLGESRENVHAFASKSPSRPLCDTYALANRHKPT